MIDRLCEFLAAGNRFDVVILDSVLNAVGPGPGEHACLTILNGLCKPGGIVGFSGKSRDSYEFSHREDRDEAAFSVGYQDQIRFLDDEGRTAIYGFGGWYFHKFHTLAEVQDHGHTYIGDQFTLYNGGRRRPKDFVPYHGTEKSFRSGEMWQCCGYKSSEVTTDELVAAVTYEFELPYRSGRAVGRSADVLDALERGGFLS
jgi:hypothetical protein